MLPITTAAHDKEHKPSQSLSGCAEHRLRLAALFLRQDGHEFNCGEFYAEVLNCIATLNQSQTTHLRSLVDWIEEYEIAEQKICGVSARSRAQKAQNRSGKKGALRPAPPAPNDEQMIQYKYSSKG